MNSVVLDASAVLAVIHRETGHQKVLPHLKEGLISAVNYAEVLKKAVERGSELITTRLLIQNFALAIIPFDSQQAVETARLWPEGRKLGLSFADRACLALALLRSLPLITADGQFSKVDLPIKLKMIR